MLRYNLTNLEAMKASFWATVVLVSFLVVFIVQNAAPARIHVLFWNIEISMALMLFFVFLLGFVIGMIWFKRGKNEIEVKELPEEIQE